jgi:hypothetical protein
VYFLQRVNESELPALNEFEDLSDTVIIDTSWFDDFSETVFNNIGLRQLLILIYWLGLAGFIESMVIVFKERV